jgi:hypothetical protein
MESRRMGSEGDNAALIRADVLRMRDGIFFQPFKRRVY